MGPRSLLNVASPVAAPWPGIGDPAACQVLPSSVERFTRISVLLAASWYESHAFVPAVVIHGRSAPALSMKMCVQPLGAVVPAGQRVTLTPSWTPLMLRLKLTFRSTSRVVPADVNLTSASSSPSVVRPAPTLFRSVSMAPKYDGVAPKCPFHRFTWNGSQASPSTAMVPSLANVMAGSLLPVEFAFGAVVTPEIGKVEISGVLVNAGVGGLPAAAADGSAMPAVARAANAPMDTSLLRMKFRLIGDWHFASDYVDFRP